MIRKKYQGGHAALLFAMIIPVLFGVFTLATDGARAVQDKARLEEATEVATLAVAGQNSDDKATQKAIAKKYIEYYFPLAEVPLDQIEVEKLSCEDNDACDKSGSSQRFFQYNVTASVVQKSWFPGNEAIVGLGETYDVKGASVARKYQSEAVDVVLVADFSASMYERWIGGSNRKYQDLKDIIIEVANELKNFNQRTLDRKNTLSVVGFDFYTSRLDRYNNRYFYDHLVCEEEVWHWGEYYYNGRRRVRDRIYDGVQNVRCNSRYPGQNSDEVNYTETVAQIFNTNHFSHQPVSGPITNISQFHDIDLTSSMDTVITELNEYRRFYIGDNGGSGTSSYAGMIRGAQIAMSGDNPRRIIILLSDGQDSYSTTTDRLISAGLCTKIFDTLNQQINSNGDSVKARMVAVGFDYPINSYPQMRNCVGAENVYQAQDEAAIKNRILELITEEIGHLAPSDED
ncbi:TadE/TadG family type IV pilus assembly protein [Methylophaga thalassica]|uniref:TadE/TadG family type IV pilus assembly protein n=1 Tax=Methylophaga aminisulfidivorans TaxID=230105 RepID=UPI003A93AABF